MASRIIYSTFELTFELDEDLASLTDDVTDAEIETIIRNAVAEARIEVSGWDCLIDSKALSIVVGKNK